MSKKTWILISCLVLSLTLGLGGSLAYLTDTDTKVNTFTMGDVDIEVEEPTGQTYPGLKPGVTIDKEAKINNIGDNDAWVWLTVAIPQQIADVVTPVWNTGVEVDRVDTIKDNAGNEFKQYTVRVDEVLVAGASTGNLLTDVTMSSLVDYVDGKYYKVEGGNRVEIDYDLSRFDVIVTGYAIQKDGFDTVEAAYEAYTAQWGEAVLNSTTVDVATSEELVAALATDVQNIVVNLTGDVEYVIDAWERNAMGGASTEGITIIGNGHTLSFSMINRDWNNIVTNGAKLTLNNVNLVATNEANNTWNGHDLVFDCDVEMTNVVSNRAFAFEANAKLTNVTISDANDKDTYAIWIRPNGQTVTLDNCVIDMLDCTNGRGIKIDDQYVDAPEKVTLVVKNTTFKTEAKSAILVKCAAGADITATGNDISGVAADSTNVVWVDKASAAYADLVTVNGCLKIVEP